VSDESTAILQGQLERAVTGDAQARQHLLELTRYRLMRQARRFLHGHCARLEPFALIDDVVQQLYLEILQNQDRFWVNAQGEPVRTLAEFFGHTSAWMRDVLCDQLLEAYGRADNRPAVPRPAAPRTTAAVPWLTPQLFGLFTCALTLPAVPVQRIRQLARRPH
jgi:hypothetical protein